MQVLAADLPEELEAPPKRGWRQVESIADVDLAASLPIVSR